MSSKKSNLNSKDHQYMNLAINLAKDHIGLTGLNPSVGCLIVKNDEIISTGQTGLNGRPHAEYNAIKNNKRKNHGSTLYVTMEPCTHHGLTPPCTSQILKSKIKKVTQNSKGFIYYVSSTGVTGSRDKLSSKNLKISICGISFHFNYTSSTGSPAASCVFSRPLPATSLPGLPTLV